MYEKDKMVLAAYRTCMDGVITAMKENEEVDFASSCNVEREKVLAYTLLQYNMWLKRHPSELSEKKQQYFNPKLPYH